MDETGYEHELASVGTIPCPGGEPVRSFNGAVAAAHAALDPHADAARATPSTAARLDAVKAATKAAKVAKAAKAAGTTRKRNSENSDDVSESE